MTGLPPPTSFGGRWWAPAELDALAAGWWAELNAAMPRPPGVVAAVLPSHPEGVALFFALSALPGAVAVLGEDPTAWRSAPPLPPDTPIVLPPVRARLAPAGGGRRVIVLPEQPGGRGTGNYRPFRFSCVVAFTTGSTGLPKPVCWPGPALFESARAAAIGLGLRGGDGVLGALPFAHTHGLRGVLATAIALGGPLGLVDRFDHRSVLALFATGEHRHFPCTPIIADLLSRCPLAGPPPRAPELIRVSAGRLSQAVFRAFSERFGVPARPAYGATESGILTHEAGPADAVRWDCVGWPVPGVELRIGESPVAPDAAGTPGRVWFRARARMAGYGFPPALTACEEQGGWRPTADVGVLEADGRLRLTGRLDDRFKTAAGQLVDPEAIAAVLRGHPGVREVAVVPLGAAPDTRIGAVVESEAALEPDALRAWAARCLPTGSRPHALLVVKELPRTRAGKIDRERCVEALSRARTFSR
jgi:acyl-CoA synthetase (AMP-forming)/AMP-acid ligase II